MSFIFSDAVVAQVLDELGLQMADELSGKYSDFIDSCAQQCIFLLICYVWYHLINVGHLIHFSPHVLSGDK